MNHSIADIWTVCASPRRHAFLPDRALLRQERVWRRTAILCLLPAEMLEGIELWAAAHSNPRSRAIRLLVYRGLAHVGIPL